MLHLTKLISQLAVLRFDVPQSVHLDLQLVELTSAAKVGILGPVSLKQLLSQHVDLIIGPIGPLIS